VLESLDDVRAGRDSAVCCHPAGWQNAIMCDFMKTKSKSTGQNRGKSEKTALDSISRRKRRRLLKTLAGAAIGGAIAGPVGVAAGAILGASVRRGPARKKTRSRTKTKPQPKAKAPRKNRAAKRRFVNIYPNIP